MTLKQWLNEYQYTLEIHPRGFNFCGEQSAYVPVIRRITRYINGDDFITWVLRHPDYISLDAYQKLLTFLVKEHR